MTSTIYIILFFIYGICIGSFLNVVIYRLPNKMNLSKPSSHCPKCNSNIRWYDNIPLLSYILLRGKCRNCGCHISIRYFIVELITGLLFIYSYILNQDNIYLAIIYVVIMCCLICIFFIDLDNMFILDRFNVILLVCGILSLFVDKNIDISSKILGMVLAGVIFLSFYFGSILIIKREGLGFGDVKFMIVCGLLLGIGNTLLSILLASMLASVTILLFLKKKESKEYPFAPFLVIGVIIALFIGNDLINWYISLL